VRGRYQGVFWLSWSIAGFTAPVAGGFVRDLLGNTALWTSCALIACCAAAINLAADPTRDRHAAAPTTAPRVPAPGPADEFEHPTPSLDVWRWHWDCPPQGHRAAVSARMRMVAIVRIRAIR
jgi:hypothetical protein